MSEKREYVLDEIIGELRQENKRLRDALRWYADPGNYLVYGNDDAEREHARRAREALGEVMGDGVD